AVPGQVAPEPGPAALDEIRVADAREELPGVGGVQLEVELAARRRAAAPRAGGGERRVGVGHRELVEAPVLARAAAPDLDPAELLAAQAEALGDQVERGQVLRLERAVLWRPRIRLRTEKTRKARDQPAAAVLAVGKVARDLLRSDGRGPAGGTGARASA